MSRRWFVGVALLIAGCDQVFDLDRDFDAPVGTLDASLEGCPISYQAITGGETKYRFSTRATYWLDAQNDCVDDTSPSITHLVEFGTAGELEVLQRVFPTTTGQWESWTGYARDRGTDGYVFFSSTGEQFMIGAPAWAAGEPNAATIFGEETTTFFGNDHEIYDGPSVAGHQYICECDGRAVVRTFDVAVP